MKLGAKNVEWILVAALAIVIITQFLILSGGIASNTIQTTMIHVLLLMSFGGTLIVAIILLRIYDVLAMTHALHQAKKK